MSLSESLSLNDKDVPKEIVVPLSMWYYFFGLLIGAMGCLLFATGYFIIDWDSAVPKTIWAVAVTLFFCLWFTVVGIYFFNRESFGLVINHTGIHERFVLGRRSVLWSDIESIEMQDVDGQQRVVFVLKNRTSWRWWSLGRFDAWIENQYSLSQKELFSLLRSRHVEHVEELEHTCH